MKQRTETSRKMKELFLPPPVATACLTLLGYLVAIAGLSWAAQLAANVAVTVAAAVLLASCFKGLNNIVHECSHRSFCRSPRVNRILGSAVCVLLLTDFDSYLREHSSHHRYLGDYERDLDFQLREGLDHSQRITWTRIARDLVTLRVFLFYLPRVSPRNPRHLVGLALLAGALLALGAAGAWHAVAALGLSYVVFLAMLRYLIDIVDHGGLYRADIAELYKSRNFIVRNPLVRWMLFPRNDCYHLVHHLYPYVPVSCFGQAHALLLEEADYRRLPHAARFAAFDATVQEPA